MPGFAPSRSPGNATEAEKTQYAAIEQIQLAKLADTSTNLRRCFHTNHECQGMWVMFPSDEAKLPRTSCFVVDSGTRRDDVLLLSEAAAATVLVKFQLDDDRYTAHHTRPALVATLLRDQTARLTHAYFDGKQNSLLLRQSQALDLSSLEPSCDAWTLLCWIVNQPVGETRYATGEDELQGLFRDDAAKLASRIST